eukprot:m51a1_g10739 hypothetical protein (199) ;mRNA; f:314570-315765
MANEFETFKALSLSSEGWAEGLQKHGVRVTTKSVAGSAFLVMRGEGVVARPVDEVLALCSAPERRLEWDTLAATCTALHRDDDGTVLLRYTTKAPMLVSPREFLLEMRTTKEADGTAILVAHSVTREGVEPLKKHVLGNMQTTGFVLQPLPDNKTRVIYTVQADPAGWLPSSLVNKVSLDQPLGILGLRKVLTGSIDE